jgi:hypothetical protein
MPRTKRAAFLPEPPDQHTIEGSEGAAAICYYYLASRAKKNDSPVIRIAPLRGARGYARSMASQVFARPIPMWRGSATAYEGWYPSATAFTPVTASSRGRKVALRGQPVH